MSEASVKTGLSSAEARRLLLQYGANAIAEDHPNAWISFLKKFWAPVPWMLEITILLQLFLGKRDEAAVIVALLVFNAILSFVQESRANNALSLLKSRLEIRVRVFRDGTWKTVLAQDLV
ncbi:MAG TPA: cation-transporting P-type ATPase, partial [Burkholderiales bacterium]|nr:cation-transporting P-type ATPase [Burkholderiales bacterium]